MLTAKQLFQDNTSKGLRSSSDSILGAFKKTVDGLQDISDRALNEKEAREEQIKFAQQEVKELEIISKNNLSIISKLNNLMSIE